MSTGRTKIICGINEKKMTSILYVKVSLENNENRSELFLRYRK